MRLVRDPGPRSDPAAEEAELHQHGEARDLGARPADQLEGRLGGAAGGQDVVDDQDTVLGAEVLGVDLDLGRAVPRSYAWLRVAPGGACPPCGRG